MSDNTQRNKEYWSEQANVYDSKFEKTISDIIEAIRRRRDFIGADWVGDGGAVASGDAKSARLLDYACGPGTFSRALYPYVTECRGIDLSPGMVAAYNERAKREGLSPRRMHAIEGNILADPPSAALSDPSLSGFDLAGICMGAHHLDDPTLAARHLVGRLRPGGVLFVCDLLVYDVPESWKGDAAAAGPQGQGHSHGHGNNKPGEVQAKDDGALREIAALPTIAHHGFTREEMRAMFEAAGAGEGFALEVVDDVQMPHGDQVMRTVFFARGTKPAAGSGASNNNL